MSETKHTKGPWKWTKGTPKTHQRELIQANFEGQGEDSILYHSANWPISKADARLIAAAPDLLRVALDCRVYIERAIETGPACENAKEMQKALLATIAKAKKGENDDG